MKKINFAFLIFAALITVSAFAAEPTEVYVDMKNRLYQYGGLPSGDEVVLTQSGDLSGAYEALYFGIKNLAEWVDVSAYSITPDELNTVFGQIVNNNPEFFYLESHYMYTQNNFTGMAGSISLFYNCEKTEIPERIRLVEAEAEKLVAQVNADTTDYERILLVNEYLCLNYEYDHSSDPVYDMYNLFTRKKGVCQAYALASTYLLRRLGVKCSTIPSDTMGHAWNMVMVNSEWYHLDVTWNDTGYGFDIPGMCGHDYFLKSDSYMNSHSHYGWSFDYPADSVAFDYSFLNDYSTALAFHNGIWYGSKNGRISVIDPFTGETQPLYSPDLSDAPLGWQFNNSYSFNIGAYKEYIICNTHDGLYAMDTESKSTRKIYSLDSAGCIYGMAVNGDKAVLWVGDKYVNEKNSKIPVDLEALLVPKKFAITGIDVCEEQLTVSFTADESYEGEPRIYAAGYDTEGEIVFVCRLDLANISVHVPPSAVYKAFIWDGETPLCKCAVLDTTQYI